jgi:hypothetical protein
MDFTIHTYTKLLDALLKAGYSFQTFTEFLEKPAEKVILLRHDVDAKKLNSWHFARMQYERGIKGTYYFRMVPQSYDPEVIRKIAEMGHEIGYHYEDMDFASKVRRAEGRGRRAESIERRAKGGGQRAKGGELRAEGEGQRAKDTGHLEDLAIKIFEKHLMELRALYPVKTICMHGSPRSPYDNKAVWKKYDYRDYGIIGEPYFDIDFNAVFYLTDTGRRWDGEKVSVRDKVDIGLQVAGSGLQVQKPTNNPQRETRNLHPAPRNAQHSFHSTLEIIRAAEQNTLPDQIMFTFHPQRWTNRPVEWLWELFFQNLKNQVKAVLIRRREKGKY